MEVFQSQENYSRWKVININELKCRLYDTSEKTLASFINIIYESYAECIGYPSNRWGCKTPNLTLYRKYIRKIFPNAQFIFIYRKSNDVVASFRNTQIKDFNIGNQSLFLWRLINKNIIKNYSGSDLFISYDDILKNDNYLTKVKKKLDFKNNCFTVFKSPDLSFQHLNNVSTEISVKSINNIRELYKDMCVYEKLENIKETVS